MLDFSNIRREFSTNSHPMSLKDFLENPLEQCALWLKQVLDEKLLDGNAMTLSTSTLKGEVSSRVVLLKYLTRQGFIFFTNYNSRKALDIRENPKVSLNFYWPTLNRQIIVYGTCEKISYAESKKYFDARPRMNQLIASVSKQDQVIESTEEILKQIDILDQKFKDQPLPLPHDWGGFIVKPTRFEFWQGGVGRLNLRFCYTQKNQNWMINQLSP